MVRFVFWPDKADGDRIYVNTYLMPQPFFKRLWLGLKYILGYTSKFGHHEETIITPGSATKLQTLLSRLLLPTHP